MAWYKVGTIAVTNGSTTVTGSGTDWIPNAQVGEALYAPDGKLYEITNVVSDTVFNILPAYLGATASAQPYVIVPSQSYLRDLAAQAADLVNNYSTVFNTVGQGKFNDGTLAEPGIRFSADTDTGFFRSASNEVTFVAGGVAQFKYNTSGFSLTTGGELVGTTATQTLTNKTLTAPTITGAGTAEFGNLSYTGTLTGGTGVVNIGSGQVYKDASGNVGVGTGSPGARLEVSNGSANNEVRFTHADNVPGRTVTLRMSSTGSGGGFVGGGAYIQAIQGAGIDAYSLTFGTPSASATATERMRIDSSGNLLVGTASTQQSRIVSEANGTSVYGLTTNMTAGSGTRFHIVFRENSSERGSITSAGSSVAYNTASDYRLKENVAPMQNALATVAALKPCTYKWKADGSQGQGFIAHELQEVVPDCVTGTKDAVDADGNPQYQGVDTSFLVATLVAALQEQQALIQDLTTRLTTLEGN